MDSGIVRTSSISSRNRDRAAARREVQEELNLAHMSGVMKSVRRTAREEGSGKSRVVLEEHPPSPPSNSSKPVLRIETEFHNFCPDYYKLGPSIIEKKHGRVSTPVRGEDADRRQNAEGRRYNQKSRIPQPKDTKLPEAVEEQIEETAAPRRHNPTIQAEDRRHSQRSKTSRPKDTDLHNAIGEQTKETPALKRQKPNLHLPADFATTLECPPLDPQAPKKELRSSPASKGDTDRNQAAQLRRHGQTMKQSQLKETKSSPVVRERSTDTASRRDTDRHQTVDSRNYSGRIKKPQPKESSVFSTAAESPASKGDTGRHEVAHPRSYSQRVKKPQPKDTTFSPTVKEQSKESPVRTRQKPTLQSRRDSASAECLAQSVRRQTKPDGQSKPHALQNEQRHIMEIISLYEDVREEKKEDDVLPPIPPISERRGKEQSSCVASGHSGTDDAVIPATHKQAEMTSAPKRHKPTLRVRTDLDGASHLGYSTWASQQLPDNLQMNPLALETEHQGVSSPVHKKSTDRCQKANRDRSIERSQRPRLVDIVRRGLAESEAVSPNFNLSGSACLYGDYSCIYEEYSE